MYNPYEILELTNTATESEVEYAYKTLRARYGEERFADGEKGNKAARMLEEVDKAYSEIKTRLKDVQAQETYGYSLGEIDDFLKRGEFDKAQRELDRITERGGEWHYLQSILFYKRNWYVESRKQLRLALEFEPENPKYRESLNRLEAFMANPAPDPAAYGRGQGMPGMYGPQAQQQNAEGRSQGGDACNALSNCCCLACLADTCCSCMNCC